jgi:GH24 family phage-related lysozyme (muramidase)
LGANINFVRLSLFKQGREVERREITANDVISGLGTNRLNASQTLNAVVTFDFNSGANDFDTSTLEFNFTDDRGNTQNIPLNLTQIVGQSVCTL